MRAPRLSRRLRLSQSRAPLAWATACAVVERVTSVRVPARREAARATAAGAYARQLAFYVAVIGFDVVRKHVAAQAGCHHAYVQETLSRLEAERDKDPLLEELLDQLVAVAQADEARAAA